MKKTQIRNVSIVSSSMPLFWEQANNGIWEPFTFDCIDKYVKEGSTFIDIGSWNGVFSVYADKLGAKTFAVEPDPVAFKDASELIRINNAGTKIEEVAISYACGTSYLNSMTGGFGNSESSLLERGAVKGSVPVNVKTLEGWLCDNAISPNEISLIKMDIEGGEIEVLKQAKDYIIEHRPPMHISFHPAWLNDFDKDIDSILFLFDVYQGETEKGEICVASNFKEILNSHQHAIMFS